MKKQSETIIKKDFIIKKEVLVARKNCLYTVCKHYSLDSSVYLGAKYSYERKNANNSRCFKDVDYDKNGKIIRVLETVYDRYGNVSEKIMIQNGKIDVRYTQVNRYKGKLKPISQIKYYESGKPRIKIDSLFENNRLSEYKEKYEYNDNGSIRYLLINGNEILRDMIFSCSDEVISNKKTIELKKPFLKEILRKNYNEVLNQSKNVRSLEDYCDDSVTSA